MLLHAAFCLDGISEEYLYHHKLNFKGVYRSQYTVGVLVHVSSVQNFVQSLISADFDGSSETLYL